MRWHVLGTVDVIDDVFKLDGISTCSSLHANVEITCDNDSTRISRYDVSQLLREELIRSHRAMSVDEQDHNCDRGAGLRETYRLKCFGLEWWRHQLTPAGQE